MPRHNPTSASLAPSPNTEDSYCGVDADRHDEHGQDGKTRALAQAADVIAKILDEAID
jgi:hypothetical protein